MSTTVETTTPKQAGPTTIPVAWRWLISAAVIFHLTAVFISPFTFATGMESETASPLASAAQQALRPYIDAVFLNHGYAFFAPDPGPSHLVRYEVHFEDGREPVEGTFPDLERHWPRLLYHRHFMLAESLNANFVPPEPPPRPPAEIEYDSAEYDLQVKAWDYRRGLYDTQMKAFENHLLSVHDGAAYVDLARIEHALLTPYQFERKRRKLDEAELYIRLNENMPANEIIPEGATP